MTAGPLVDRATVRVTTANICGLPVRPLDAVRARIAQAVEHGGVVFTQEMTAPGYAEAFKLVAHHAGLGTTWDDGKPLENLIAVPTDLENESAHVLHVHGGMPKVSPARVIAVVRGTINGLPVAFLNCHTVSKPRRGVRASWWRIAKHALYLSRLSAEVALLRSQGYTVVCGGDMNATRKRLRGWLPHPSARLIASQGLDHLWVVPADGVHVTVRHHHPIPRTRLMDHPILSATLTITGATHG